MAITVVLPVPVASFRAQTVQFGVGLPIGAFQAFQQALPLLGVGSVSGQPDGSFCRLDLAKIRLLVVELVVAPVLEQARGFRGDAPLILRWLLTRRVGTGSTTVCPDV